MNKWYANSGDLRKRYMSFCRELNKNRENLYHIPGISLINKEITRWFRFKTVSDRILPSIIIMFKDVDVQHIAPRQNAVGAVAEKGGDVLYLAGRGSIRSSLYMRGVLHYPLWWISC